MWQHISHKSNAIIAKVYKCRIYLLWKLYISTVCYCPVTYDFQSESTLYSHLDVKELLARNRCHIRSLSNCNGIRTYNDLVRKRTLFSNLFVASNPVSVIWTSDIAPVSRKEFLDIQATIESRFTLKLIRDMIITYSQIHRTDKHSQHSSMIWPVWLNGWVCVYELSGCGFDLKRIIRLPGKCLLNA